jgi:hypothetical protein
MGRSGCWVVRCRVVSVPVVIARLVARAAVRRCNDKMYLRVFQLTISPSNHNG